MFQNFLNFYKKPKCVFLLNRVFKLLILMKLNFFSFNEAALHIAVEQGNLEMVQLILNQPKIDINSISIYT